MISMLFSGALSNYIYTVSNKIVSVCRSKHNIVSQRFDVSFKFEACPISFLSDEE